MRSKYCGLTKEHNTIWLFKITQIISHWTIAHKQLWLVSIAQVILVFYFRVWEANQLICYKDIIQFDTGAVKYTIQMLVVKSDKKIWN